MIMGHDIYKIQDVLQLVLTIRRIHSQFSPDSCFGGDNLALSLQSYFLPTETQVSSI